MKIELRPLHEIFPYPGNARKIPQSAIDSVAKSLLAFGWQQPIVVDRAGVIIVGHTRRLAALHFGWTEAPVTVFEGTAAQARQYRLMDNRSHEDSSWEPQLLTAEMLELRGLDLDLSLTGFSSRELDGMLRPALAGEDDAPPVPEVALTQPGDLWTLGEHRLLCGDATNADAVKRVCGGKLADLVFTDPPYGVNYTGGAKKREKLEGDHLGTEIYAKSLPNLAFAAADHAPLYLWYADAHAAAAAAAAAAAGYVITAQIIWVKNNAQFVSSAHYHGKHEPMFYAHRKGKKAAWFGLKNEVTVWECNRAVANDMHPTQKPVALAERAFTNSTKRGDHVLDLFVGSGSTIAAAQVSERRAIGLEIDPKYCDVAVRRWMNLTGKVAYNQDGVCFPN